MSAELTREEVDAISAALASENKIEAIKLYREATGKGLAEAKAYIESFDARSVEVLAAGAPRPGNSSELTPEEVEAISEALAQGNKIAAIKLYREATGKGLRDSKDFIDVLIPQLKQQDPERFARAGEVKMVGCGAKVLLLVALGVLGRWIVELLA